MKILFLISALWFVCLWMFRFAFMRCECGAFYHTDKERRDFINFVLFSLLSTGVVFGGAFLYSR
jgi:RsiW-degrading membrane proteinase PrsW (M82 family)